MFAGFPVGLVIGGRAWVESVLEIPALVLHQCGRLPGLRWLQRGASSSGPSNLIICKRLCTEDQEMVFQFI